MARELTPQIQANYMVAAGYKNVQVVNGTLHWTGAFQPTALNRIYKVKLKLDKSLVPILHVKEPDIHLQYGNELPHCYHAIDHRLCLYEPKDHPNLKYVPITRTVLRWTSEWLYYFEAWESNGKIWIGPESSHTIGKKKE